MILDYTIAALLVIAGFFGLVGSFGVLKLPDQMTRLHAPTKATTLGVGGVLIASMLYVFGVSGSFSFHELMITLFLFLAAPITAFFIARVQLRNHVADSDLPKPDRAGQRWAGQLGQAPKAD